MISDRPKRGVTVTLVRRLTLILAVMFWQGGFMFYGAVVVPVGTAVLDSDLLQGFITRSVTGYLNLAGLVAVALWGVESATGAWARRSRLAVWGVMAITLAAQFLIRDAMNGLLDPDELRVLERAAFRDRHVAYLLVSTFQWAAAVGLLALTLEGWRRVPAPGESDGDRMTAGPIREENQ